MNVAKEICVRHLEKLVAQKRNEFLDDTRDTEIFFIPLIEEHVAFVNNLDFSKCQLVIISWLWWVQDIPKLDVLEI